MAPASLESLTANWLSSHCITTSGTKETISQSCLLCCGPLTQWGIPYQALDGPSHLISFQCGLETPWEQGPHLTYFRTPSACILGLTFDRCLVNICWIELKIHPDNEPKCTSLKLYFLVCGNHVTKFFFHTSSLWGKRKGVGWELYVNIYWTLTKCQAYMVSKNGFI